ncbi:MAG: response regulator transcription factor [Anaerolineales bacterium]|nr:response regulator transcription factor [Anaerolineales bacterium]MBS3753548.1 response regulator transcription factor [Anaerolineales bacterium]
MDQRILIVEDDSTLQETLKYNLEREGYQVNVVGDGIKALESARDIKPDLIIMDIMLPGMDGVEITRILRHESSVPIIMLTAKDEEIDRVLGLEIGADDYLTKPFSMRELVARVKAQLRRQRLVEHDLNQERESEESILQFGNLTMDLNRREVSLDDQQVSLKPKEFDLLCYLVQHQGHVLSRDRILEKVWGWDYHGESRTVDVHIRWLRKKIEEDPSNPKRILTVRGVGYRFEE